MALKFSVPKLEDVPEGQRPLYTQKDGKFVLDVEGAVSEEEYDALNAKVAEFRDNNIKLKKDHDALVDKFKDIDPEEVKTLKADKDKFTRSGVTKPDDIEAAIRRAVDAATAPITQRLDAAEKERNEAQGALVKKDRDDRLWSIAAKAGVLETAKPDFLFRANSIWQTKDGQVIAMDGDKQIFSKRKGRASEPMTPEEWVVEVLPTEAGHLFKPSKGSGAQNEQRTTSGGLRMIANDTDVVAHNLEEIAKGTVVVQAAQ